MKLTISFIILFSICLAFNVERTIRLNTGKECPVIGLATGGFKIGGQSKNKITKEFVRQAINEFGYRHIDTANAYGTEKAVGQAISELISEGLIKREDLFITTKIFPNFQKGLKGRSGTVRSVQLALNRLNTTYIDLLLIHFATPDPVINRNIWFTLEESLSRKIVRSIGVSNFNETDLKQLIKKSKVVPAMVQLISHPKKIQRKLIDFCQRNGIQVTAYLPMNSGSILNDTNIQNFGQKYNKTGEQLIIRWQLQRGVVTVPKSTRIENIRQNINVFDFNLTDDEINILEDLYYK